MLPGFDATLHSSRTGLRKRKIRTFCEIIKKAGPNHRAYGIRSDTLSRKINWVRRKFKTNKVWLATDDQGRPLTRGNRQLIKYQLTQDHEYWVNPANIRPLEAAAAGKSSATSRARRATPRPAENIPPNAICIYTDGASSGNPGPAGIGVVLRYKARVREISRYIGHATNNIAELEAIRQALSAVQRKDLPVRLFTDSSYAHGLLSLGWKARRNQELVQEIKNQMRDFRDLRLIKVKGHAGIDDNERADQLATAAIRGRQ